MSAGLDLSNDPAGRWPCATLAMRISFTARGGVWRTQSPENLSVAK
jgi:hypothetical protein